MAKNMQVRDIYNQNITDKRIDHHAKDNMIVYGVNVNVMRMSMGLIDGLTPIQRRILYTMFLMKLFPDAKMTKVSNISGQVMSRFSPHGDASINQAATLMGRVWDNTNPYLDKSGNFGEITGDGAAHARYLEARLSRYAMKCFFEEFDEKAIEMVDAYTQIEKEPVHLPSKYPNFLINGTKGIGWSVASSMPPFNLEEAFRLTQALMENPDMNNVFLFPDSPRGYEVIDDGTAVDICNQSKETNTFKLRSRIDYDPKEHKLIVKSLPEAVLIDPVLDSLTKLYKASQLPGIKDVKDSFTNKDRSSLIDIYLKKEADPELIKSILYKKTQMSSSATLDIIFAERTRTRRHTIKSAILEWIDRRIDLKQRIYMSEFKTLKEREIILEIIRRILTPENFQLTSNIIRNSDNKSSAITALCTEYGINSFQAKTITDMGFSLLYIDTRKKLAAEHEGIYKKIMECSDKIKSKSTIKNIIYNELEEGITLFGKPRQCPIIHIDDTILEKPEFKIVVTNNFVKKISSRATNVGLVASDDEIKSVFNCTDDDKVHILDEFGKVFTIQIGKLLANDLSSRGTSLESLFGITSNIIMAFKCPNKDVIENQALDLVMFTENGLIKRTALGAYVGSVKELQGILLNSDDKVCFATIVVNDVTLTTGDVSAICEGDNDLVVYTDNGFGICLDIKEVKATDRLTKGTKFLKLEDGVKVEGAIPTLNATDLLILTKKGYGKIISVDDIFSTPTKKRRDTMFRLTSLVDGDTVLTILPTTSNDKKLTVVTTSGNNSIMIDEIERTTRLSKGKKLSIIKRGDTVVKIKKS